MCALQFTDSQVQQCYDRQFEETAEPSEEVRQVRALIATYDLFVMLDGEHSRRVHEATERLLQPGMRSALRRWYQRTDAATNDAAVGLRNLLGVLTQKQFGPVSAARLKHGEPDNTEESTYRT